MISLWARAVRRHRTEKSETVSIEDGDFIRALTELCAKMDLPRPMILPKHEREWTNFQQTTFLRDHFLEAIPYDRLELEQIDPDAKKPRVRDPRIDA